MKRIILIFVILLIILLFNKINIFSQINNTDFSKFEKKGKFYLVIIAIDIYQNRLNLTNHVNYAKQIKDVLYNNYEIDEVIELYNYNATLNNIENALFKLQSKLQKQDSLIIYYSGHGFIDINGNDSYWLPYNAGINENSKDFWFSNNDLLNYLKNIKAKQILLINDSSFNNNLIEPISIDELKIFNNEHLKKSYSNQSRQFLGSGISETGSEQSEFSQYLFDSLKILKDQNIDIEMVYKKLRFKMKESEPKFSKLKNIGHNEGANFVLFKRTEKPLIIKKEEISKEEEKKDNIITIQKSLNLNTIDKAGTVLIPVGATIATTGISLFIIDVVVFFPLVRERMTNGTTYADYEFYYNTNLALFCSSIVITAVGLGVTGAGIGLKVYAARKKKLSFNLELDNSIKAYFTLRF